MTEGGLSPTVSFCSAAHFERPASTADGRVMTCKEDGVTCMSCDTQYHKHISVKQTLVHVYVCISPTNTPPETLHANRVQSTGEVGGSFSPKHSSFPLKFFPIAIQNNGIE